MIEPVTRLQREEIKRFLATGDNDLLSLAWEGGIVEGGRRAKQAMLAALVAEVGRRSRGRRQARAPESLDLERLVRSKVEPMVSGLFPRAEQDTILAVLERSIVFVTTENLETVLRGRSFLRSAWGVARTPAAQRERAGGRPDFEPRESA